MTISRSLHHATVKYVENWSGMSFKIDSNDAALCSLVKYDSKCEKLL